jgi:hypothetical protein
VVLYWMQRRGLTRKIFADRMGKSLSWVDKIRPEIASSTAYRCCVRLPVCSIFPLPCWLVPRKPNANGPARRSGDRRRSASLASL